MKPALGHVYQDLDAKFPDFSQSLSATVPPRSGSIFVQLSPGGGPGMATQAVNVDHLSARYYGVLFNDGVNQVTWDLSNLAAIPNLEANLVVLPLSGPPRVVSLPAVGTTLPKLCDVQQIQSAILVISNSDLTAPATGSVVVKGMPDSCEATPPPAAAITFTAVQPSHVTAGGGPITLKLSGTGFAALDHTAFVFGAGMGGSALITDFLPGGGQEKDTFVSDTEIDIQIAIDSSNPSGVYDAAIGGSIGGAHAEATCARCLTITSP